MLFLPGFDVTLDLTGNGTCTPVDRQRQGIGPHGPHWQNNEGGCVFGSAGNDGQQVNDGAKPCDDPELPLGAMGDGHRAGEHDPDPTELEHRLDESIHHELGVSTLFRGPAQLCSTEASMYAGLDTGGEPLGSTEELIKSWVLLSCEHADFITGLSDDGNQSKVAPTLKPCVIDCLPLIWC